MKSNLQILIEHLEGEQDLLEKEIQNCIKASDFLSAATFQEPLFYIRRKLKIFKNLENSNYDRIVALRNKIEYLEKLDENDFFSKKGIKKMKLKIPKYEEELRQLENEKNININDNDHIITGLYKIVLKEIKQFEIEVGDYEIQIALYNFSALKISLQRQDMQSLNYVIPKERLSKLMRLGFTIDGYIASKSLLNFETPKILSIMNLLSRLFYDVLNYYGNKTGIIKY